MPQSLYLVNSNGLFCEGLKQILEGCPFAVEAMREDLNDLVSGSEDVAEGAIVLIDSADDGPLFIDGLREAKEQLPSTKFVVLTSKADKKQFARCVHAGVDGYLFKTISPDVLAGALHLIALGEKVYPSSFATWLVESMQPRADEPPTAAFNSESLSKREIDVLRCLVEGLSNKMIARKLQISDATVKIHVKKILKKMNAANRTQAAVLALNKNNVSKVAERCGYERNFDIP